MIYDIARVKRGRPALSQVRSTHLLLRWLPPDLLNAVRYRHGDRPNSFGRDDV